MPVGKKSILRAQNAGKKDAEAVFLTEAEKKEETEKAPEKPKRTRKPRTAKPTAPKAAAADAEVKTEKITETAPAEEKEVLKQPEQPVTEAPKKKSGIHSDLPIYLL